jgi:drug/metabolite transporter (DMT)-like permease
VSDQRRNDRLAIFGSALLFSTGGVAIKWIALGAWQVAAVRAAFAAIAVWWLVPGPVTMRSKAVVLTGVAQGCSMLLFVFANKLTTAANAIFLQSAAPLYIPILAAHVLGERTTKRDLAAMAGITIGLLMFFVGAEPATATAPNPRLGDIIAVASGVAWACTVVGLRYLAREAPAGPDGANQEILVPDAWLQASAAAEAADHELTSEAECETESEAERATESEAERATESEAERAIASEAEREVESAAEREIASEAEREIASKVERSTESTSSPSPPVATARPTGSPAGAAKGALLWGNMFVVLVALPLAWPLPATGGGDWALLLYLGIAQVALAYRLLVRAVARVPALEASLLALFEPVLNPLWAFLLLGEKPSAWAFAGAATLASVTIVRAAAGSRSAR